MNDKVRSLKDKFPKIFSKPCEISCGDGWYNILNILCHRLQGSHDWNQHLGYTQITAAQIKEKFGGLRFYYDLPPQEKNQLNGWTEWEGYVRGVVDMAEAMSVVTCETCGAPGKIRNLQGYYYTSCDEHEKKD